MSDRRLVGIGTSIFLLHGAGTLILESVWVKQQVTLLGSSPEAPGMVLLACFIGLAAGSWRARSRGLRHIGSRAFACGLMLSLALSVAIPGLIAVHLPALAAHRWLAPLVARPVIAVTSLLLIAVPSAYLGAFFPAVGRLSSGTGFVLFFTAQTAGSLAGTLAGAVYLPRALGYRAAALVAAALVLGALLLVRCACRAPDCAGKQEPADGITAAGAPTRLLLIAAGSGIFSLILQALWIRLIALASDNSVFAFGAVSVLTIALLTAAGLVVTVLPARRVSDGRLILFLIPCIIAGGGCAAWLWVRLTGGLAIRLVANAEGFSTALARAAPLVLVGSLCASLLFPVVLRIATARQSSGDTVVGSLIAVNAAGCALGTALTSFLLLPYAGIWTTLTVALAGYLLLLLVSATGRRRWVAAAAGTLLLVMCNPLRYPLVTPRDPFGGSPGTVVSAREGRFGIVTVIDYPGRIRSLWLNNTYLLEAFSGDVGATVRLGIFPTVLLPEARSLAMIGVGTGITASGFLDTRLERIVLIEMIPEVAAAARRYFRDYNRDVMSDPRVRVVIEDGRRFLAANAERYDIICSDLVTPWNEGAAALFSEEHLRTVHDRLVSGGIAVVWLPLYQLTREEFLVIARTMAAVFPTVTLWQLGSQSEHAVVALVGTDRLRIEEIAAGIRRDRAGDNPDPDALRTHESGVLSHYIGPIDSGGQLFRGSAVNTIDHPRLEFMAAREGRTLLRGQSFLDLANEFFRLPGNPGGRFFTGYDAAVEEWRLTGRDLNTYLWHLQHGEYEAAAALEGRLSKLPAFQEGRPQNPLAR